MAIVTNGNVFLAYSSPGGEAASILSIYDVKLKRERVIVELGGTGESQFSYNSQIGLVAFDWHDGIYVFPFDTVSAIPDDRNALARFRDTLTLVLKCERCFKPHWSGRRQIEYAQYREDGTEATKRVDLPELVLGERF
jgi:hypothetical protein